MRLLSILIFLSAPLYLLAQKTYQIKVNLDGTFTPQYTFLRDGDKVQWLFADRTQAIVPIDLRDTNALDCSAYRAYDPNEINEFTGPLPRAVPGIFTLGPDGSGFEIKNRKNNNPGCNYNGSKAVSGDLFLCESGLPFATMTWTWENPSITGVFIRLRWDEVHLGPNQFDWTAFDREISRAVQYGKIYSISFKAGSRGTPSWIYDPVKSGGFPVKKLTFQDSEDQNNCGTTMTLGSPTDPNFKKHYFDLWKAAAERIKSKNAWYRSLAYVKPSGANLVSHENRLPNNCENGCPCSPQIWAEQGNYTPSGLYAFYTEQFDLLRTLFADKDLAYALIQAGFPLVNDKKEYKSPSSQPLPAGAEQTETILEIGCINHGLAFMVQHNGLGPRPQDENPPRDRCPNEGEHPANRPFGGVGSGCPNRWVLEEGEAGQPTAFQINNASGVKTLEELESAFRNLYDNSDGIFLEIYEERLWDAENNGPVLDKNATKRTLAQWNDLLIERRRSIWGSKIPDPFPSSLSHTFKRTADNKIPQVFYFTNPSSCLNNSKTFGAVVILANGATNLTASPAVTFSTRVSPNPFTSETKIKVLNNPTGYLRLDIFNLHGKNMYSAKYRGYYDHTEFIWNGKDNQGREVPTGLYILRMDNGLESSISKIVHQ